MKRTVNFRFSEEVLERLGKLAEGSTRTAVLEDLIERAGQVLPREKIRSSEAAETWVEPPEKVVAPTVEDLMVPEPLVPVAKRVQDISSTKRVIERPAKAGRPEQGKTTVTGRPFGPAPKGK